MRLRATQLVACALAAVLVATLLHAQRAVERVERVYGAAGPGPRRPSAPLAVPVQPRRPSAPPAVPVHAAHTPRDDRSPCRGPRSYAQTASLPWRLYDAFASTADGCATATFVAQYERGCEEMAAVLEAAAAPLNASAWLATARAPEGECRVCYVNRFDTEERPKFDAERKRAFERNGGATTDLACVFDDGSEVAATGHGDFHGFRSTLVFECAVPEPLRARACGADALRHRDTGVHVALRAGGRAHDGRVPVCAFDARARERGGVGAVAWTSGDAYVDRSGLVKGAASDAQLRAWLAAHWAGKECEIPNFKGSYLGRFPLVLADFWTSDHLSEWSRSVDAFSGTRARGTLTLKRSCITIFLPRRRTGPLACATSSSSTPAPLGRSPSGRRSGPRWRPSWRRAAARCSPGRRARAARAATGPG